MEEMETDVLPDYPDDANDNDGHWGNTAKKSRMSSYEPSSASLQSVQSSSKSIGPGTSQIYTGNFGSVSTLFPYSMRDISQNSFSRHLFVTLSRVKYFCLII